VQEILEKLRNPNIDRLDLEEAVFLFSFGNMVLTSYKEQDLEAPTWLEDSIGALKTEIKDRRRDNVLAALKENEAKYAALKTAEEKRKDIAAEIERLKSLKASLA
jgi:hypothetical protein